MREDYKTIMILGGIFAGFKKVGLTLSSCNPCPSLPSVATEDRKQFQCLDIVLKTKLDHYL